MGENALIWLEPGSYCNFGLSSTKGVLLELMGIEWEENSGILVNERRNITSRLVSCTFKTINKSPNSDFPNYYLSLKFCGIIITNAHTYIYIYTKNPAAIVYSVRNICPEWTKSIICRYNGAFYIVLRQHSFILIKVNKQSANCIPLVTSRPR